MKKSLISGAGPRALKLIGMASKLASSELVQSAKETFSQTVDELASGRTADRARLRIEQAKVIAESLGQLKGAAMKAGQLLSLDAGEYFPPEAVEILSKLQAAADPVPFEQMQRVLREDLGDRARRLAMLDPRPAASASIGQVHSAFVDGEKVAVKIQYPGVAESLDSDLAILRRLGGAFVAMSGRKMDLEPLFAEFRVVLEAESDYRRERDCLDEYRRLLGDRPEFAIPRPIDGLCERRVLTMSWEDGLRVTEWANARPPAEMRAEFARRMLDLYCDEFFQWGFVQTDPNFGNYLVREEPFQVVLLDFGATLRYGPEFRGSYIEVLRAFATGDRERTFERAVDFGLLDRRESGEARELFFQLMENSMEPFRPERQPFAFQDRDYAARTREITMKFAGSLKYSPPPRQIIFLHRKLGGLFALLKRLDVRLDLVPYWERMVVAQI